MDSITDRISSIEIWDAKRPTNALVECHSELRTARDASLLRVMVASEPNFPYTENTGAAKSPTAGVAPLCGAYLFLLSRSRSLRRYILRASA